jgi:hypothetical protein
MIPVFGNFVIQNVHSVLAPSQHLPLVKNVPSPTFLPKGNLKLIGLETSKNSHALCQSNLLYKNKMT